MLQQTHRAPRTAAIILALTLVPLAASAQTNVKPGFNLFSPEQDVQIGQQSAAQAEQQLPVLRDSEVDAYVNRIGQKLAANAGGPGFRYQFKVINASDINAFALPGGYIYLHRGIIDQAKNEGEVAGVLAHEIAHSALRHGTHQASKAYAAQAGISILGGLLGGKVGGGATDIINAVGGLGLNALFLKYSRDLETQADLRGSQILAKSGYSPADMVSFFRTLEKADGAKKTTWLSSHPAPPDRIRRIEQEARSLSVTDQPTTDVAELQRVQQRMRGSYGNAPTSAQIAQGMTSGSTNSTGSRPRTSTGRGTVSVAAPSSTYSAYTNESGLYRVSHPSNWRVYEQNGSGVLIAPEGGVGTANGQTAIAYGAILNHYSPFNNTARNRFRSGAGATLEDATQDLLAQIQNDSPHLKFVRNSAQRVNTNSGVALAATLKGVDPNTGLNERVTLVTRQLADDHLVYLLFVVPEADFSRHATVLQTMVNSLQVDGSRGH